MQEAAPKPVVPPPPAPAPRVQRPQLPGVFFDSDMGANIDSVLALAVLYGSFTKVKLIGNSVSNASLEAAAFCDAMGRFYSGPPSNAPFSPSYYNPVGLSEDGPKLAKGSMLFQALERKTAEGQPLLPHRISDFTDTADVRICLRNSLLTQKDGEGVVVLCGPANNLISALAFPGNKDLIALKAGVLVAALGSFPAGAPDPRVKTGVIAARRLFAEWPSPIIAVGTEVGTALPFPGASIDADFAWSPHHPVAEAYKAYKPMPYNAPSQAIAAALYAANRSEDLFQLSAPGIIHVLDDGSTRFEPSALGKHRYLTVPAANREQIIKAYITAASARPAPPPVRNRPQQQLKEAETALPKAAQ